MNPFVIIGAGITGASFTKFLGMQDAILLEKEKHPGGKCSSFTVDSSHGPFTFDIGGHWFHCQSNERLCDLFSGLSLHSRRAYVYLQSKYVQYPIQSHYTELADDKLIRTIANELKECSVADNMDLSYFNMLKNRYGPSLFDLFFRPYNCKMFATKETGDIMASPYERIRNVATTSAKGYNNNFYYPCNGGGIQQLTTQLLQGVSVEYGANVVNIDIDKKRVVLENGDEISYQILVNTMPLDILLQCIQQQLSEKLVSQLHHSSTYIYNLGIQSNTWQNRNWIYFADETIPFYRLGSYSVVDPLLAPIGCQALYMESTVPLSRDIIVKQLHELGFIHGPEDLAVLQQIYLSHNYCFYSPALQCIHTWLNEHGVYSIGRYGGWRWSSIHEDILEAMQLAEKLKGQLYCKHSLKT